MIELIKTIVAIVFGVTGLVILGVNLHLRRKAHQQDMEQRKRQHEQELEFQKAKHERDTIFQEKKLELETKATDAHDRWLAQQAARINDMSEVLASKISLELQQNCSWAVSALDKAKLRQPGQTLFAERLQHFREEKEFIAEKFVPLLMNRMKSLVDSGKRVHLLVDSGTTLYPLFQRLGRAFVRARENRENWLDGLTLSTNNLPGMEALIEHARLNPNSRYSRLAIGCNLLPGEPIPIFMALVGDSTIAAIDEIWKNASQDTHIICLVTGNWLRLRRTPPPCPVPLARGGLLQTEHLTVKQKYVDVSNEVYVIAPLGKLFVQAERQVVNDALSLSDTSPDRDRQKYQELDINNDKAGHVKLVSTSRMPNRALTTLSEKLKAVLQIDDQAVLSLVPDPMHLLFPFDNLPSTWQSELEEEFPHPQIRDENFRQTHFYVSAKKPPGR